MRIVKLLDLSNKEKEEYERQQKVREQNIATERNAEIERVNKIISNSNEEKNTNNKRAESIISNRNNFTSAKTNFQTDNKRKLATAKKADTSKNNFNDFVSKIKEKPHKVASILTDVASSIQASRINSGGASEKEKGNYMTLNFIQGGMDAGFGVTNLIGNSIAEAEKKIGKAFNNEELYKYGNTWQNTMKAISDINNYGNKVNSKIEDKGMRTANTVARTLGNMAPSVALSALTGGISGLGKVGTFLAKNSGGLLQAGSVAGNEMTATLNEDNSNFGHALVTGVLKGGVEYGTEKLFGGNIIAKGTSIDNFVSKGISNKVKSKVGQFLTSKGYEFAGEQIEELISDNAGYVIDKLINNKDMPGFDEWLANTGETAKITFLTSLVLQSLGLGGGTYNEVKQLNLDKQQGQEMNKWISEAQSIIKANAEQQNMQRQQITQPQNKMFLNQTSEQTNGMLNNDRLPQQSYQYEKSDNAKVNNLRQDANKYFNNSEKTRNYINMLEKIVTDKDIEIRFDGNLQTADGRNANGSYSNGVITLNPNSTKAGEFIAIHELTHAIGTKGMLNMVENYRKSNTEFDNAVKGLLKNYNSAEITEEALADISGQLFGNQEFINNVANNNPSMFRKIYNEIKYLWHQFRGYKNQNQFVEDLYYKWTQAYNRNNKSNTHNSYAIETNDKGYKYVRADRQVISGNNPEVWKEQTKNYIDEKVRNNKDVKVYAQDGTELTITKNTSGKATFRNEVRQADGTIRKLTDEEFASKLRAETHIDELGQVSTHKNGPVADTKSHDFAKDGFTYRNAYFEDIDGQYYKITMSVGKNGDINTIYNVGKMKQAQKNRSNSTNRGFKDPNGNNTASSRISSISSISSKNNDVNTTTKYSIQESENNSGSFNLQKNRFDVSGNENLANAQTLFYRTREDGLYYVQATDGSGKITYDGVFNGKKQLAKSLGEEIASKIVNTSESTNNEIYLQSDNIKSETDYMMAHRPTETGAYASNIAKGTGEWETLRPEDVYEHPEWYFDMNQEYSKESFKVLKQIKNNPNAEITIYRATIGNKINKGDWVTLSKKYAEYHNNSQFNGKGNIVELKVKAKDVQYAGDDINEFGYYPTENTKYSKNNQTWQNYLEDNFTTEGTRTNLQDILVHKADSEGSYSTKNNTNNIANRLNTIYNNAKLGEVKQVPVETLLSIQNSTGGYRTREQINNLKSNIRTNGITTPIEIYKKSDGTFAIENGNHRLEIAQELGIKDVPVKLVKSWNDVGISKENVSGIDSNKLEDKYNDRITRENSRFNDNSWNREGSMSNNNVQLKDSGRTGRNAEFYETTSNGNEFTSSNENKGNNRQQEVDDSTSFNMSNNAPSSDNNSFGTSTEENSWSRQQAEKKKQRKHYDSIIKSNYTTDEAKAIAKELMGTDTYVPESNKKQLATADERISSSGADSELNSLFSRATTGGKIEAEDIAVGERLIQYYSKTGNKAKLQEAIQATAMAGTTAGQTVQAMSLLNHQTPEGQAIWLQRSVDKMNSDLKKFRGKNAEQFNLTAEMLEKVANSENAKALEENLNEVYKELGQQVTKTTAQKIDAWRYFAMLANFRTHDRNITGNIVMASVQGIKNKVAGTIEGVTSKFNSNMERTHTIALASKEVKSFAKADIENVADRLGLNENKYNPKTRLENNMRTFKSDVMEKTVGKAFEINNNLLEAEDGWGLKAGYVKALSEYMTANKLTPEKITDKQLSKARNYAIEQAQEATFHQNSNLSTLINQLSNKNKFAKFMLDSILPFKKTPINVAKAGLEYSPMGLVKSAVYDTVQLRKGNISVNKYIDNISKGLTGTGIALIGYALAKSGILKASGSDDKDKESYDEALGNQTYSIKIGDNTYSLDWLSPSGIPLFIGAECYEIMQSQKETKASSSDEDSIYNQAIKTAVNILDSFTNAMNPMTEMSMLSGLTSALKSYEQGNSQMLANLGTNVIKSYINQFVPTVLGQIAKTTDEYERITTSTKKGILPRTIDTTKNQIMANVPVLRQMLPIKTDVWGNKIKQSENVVQRALENAVFPWTRKENSSTDVDKEILKVYEVTGESTVIPDNINKNLTIDKQKYIMTSEEYANYKEQHGKTSYHLLEDLISSKEYKKFTNLQKQVAIEKVYEYAKEQIKLDYAKQNNLKAEESTLSTTINAIKNKKGNESDYLQYLALTKEMEKDSEKINKLADLKFSEQSKQIIYENSIGKEDNIYQMLKHSSINITEYLKYKTQDFSSDKVDNGTINGKTVSISAKKKAYDYVNKMNITYNQKLLLLGMKYSLTSNEKSKLANYVNGLKITKKEKLDIYGKLNGFTVYKDGRIKW